MLAYLCYAIFFITPSISDIYQRISIIVPTYNEAENFCDIIKPIKNNLSEVNAEIIVVDDDSPDGTGTIVEEYIQSTIQNNRHSVSIIHRKNRKGLGAAILNGVENSKGEVVIVMDSDFSHQPDIIPKMLDKIEETQCDVVIVSRYVQGVGIQGWPIKRKLIS